MTFKVKACGQTLVLDSNYSKQTGRLRFVGRIMNRYNSTAEAPDGAVIRERDPVDESDSYYVEAWTPCGVVEVPSVGEFAQYYRRQIQEGALLPADKATADACGVPFTDEKGND